MTVWLFTLRVVENSIHYVFIGCFYIFKICVWIFQYKWIPAWVKAISVKFHCCNLPKIHTEKPNLRVFRQNGGIANSEDPDRTAPLGALFALFAQTDLSKNLGSLRYSDFTLFSLMLYTWIKISILLVAILKIGWVLSRLSVQKNNGHT